MSDDPHVELAAAAREYANRERARLAAATERITERTRRLDLLEAELLELVKSEAAAR